MGIEGCSILVTGADRGPGKSYIDTLFVGGATKVCAGLPLGVTLGRLANKQAWLKAGDRIESSINRLGVLKVDLA